MSSLFDVVKPSASERRSVGAEWERHFCELAQAYGQTVTLHQIGHAKAACSFWLDEMGRLQKELIPDATCWGSPSEHHEIKHKNPTKQGCYGLEAYRLLALVHFAIRVQEPVYYTIHDWQRAGAKSSQEQTPNRIADWFYADVLDLNRKHVYEAVLPSIIDGQTKEDVLQYFWPIDMFQPLNNLWTPANGRHACCGVRSDEPFCPICGRLLETL